MQFSKDIPSSNVWITAIAYTIIILRISFSWNHKPYRFEGAGRGVPRGKPVFGWQARGGDEDFDRQTGRPAGIVPAGSCARPPDYERHGLCAHDWRLRGR